MQSDKIKSGFKLLDAIYELSLISIQEGCFLLPPEIKDAMRAQKTQNLFGAKKYLTKYSNASREEVCEIQKSQSKSKDSTKNLYHEYLVNTGLSFKKIFSICFKFDEKDFDLILENNQPKIVISQDCQDDLIKNNSEKISRILQKMNQKFEKNKQKALEIYKKKLSQIENSEKCVPEVIEYQKSEFII